MNTAHSTNRRSEFIPSGNGKCRPTVKVYIRCTAEAKNAAEKCIRILPSPNDELTRLAVNTHISSDTSSIELYDCSAIFDGQTSDNHKVFEKMCQRYLDRIGKLEDGDEAETDLHPVFMTFGQTNSGKTHSIIGNVDEMEDEPLTGILVQFVSKTFALFAAKQKECRISICGLEEYGESLKTLKIYDLFAKFKANPREQVIGSPPSLSSGNGQPSFIDIESIEHLEKLMADGSESIHCGLFENRIVSCGHCLFQIDVNHKYSLSFFDMAGYHPSYKLNDNGVASNLTLNQFIQTLCHHRNTAPHAAAGSLNASGQWLQIPSPSNGLLPHFKRVLSGHNDINCLLHISDHIQHLKHTLKTLEIANMFPAAPGSPSQSEQRSEMAQSQSLGLEITEKTGGGATKTTIIASPHRLHPAPRGGQVLDDEVSLLSEFDVDDAESAAVTSSVLFSPPQRIRLSRSHRASSVLLQNVRESIKSLPIESRRKIASMPLEIFQLKKSKNHSAKKFLVPLGFSTYDSFVVGRDGAKHCYLELHLKTNKSKFYVVIDDLTAFQKWIHSQLGFESNSASPPLSPSQSEQRSEPQIAGTVTNEVAALEEALHDVDRETLRARLWRLSPSVMASLFVLNLLALFVFCFSIDSVASNFEGNVVEPMGVLIGSLEQTVHDALDRHHQHQYQSEDIVTLYGELDALTAHCEHYISDRRREGISPETVGADKLLDFCEGVMGAHKSCPIDLMFIES